MFLIWKIRESFRSGSTSGARGCADGASSRCPLHALPRRLLRGIFELRNKSKLIVEIFTGKKEKEKNQSESQVSCFCRLPYGRRVRAREFSRFCLCTHRHRFPSCHTWKCLSTGRRRTVCVGFVVSVLLLHVRLPLLPFFKHPCTHATNGFVRSYFVSRFI